MIDLLSVLQRAANQRRLLHHRFYHAWQAGELTRNDLADYAGQYRHVEQALPAVLEATAAQLPPGRARRLVEGNLFDERFRPRSHLALFDSFAGAVGAGTTSAPSPATSRLVDAYHKAAEAGPAASLAVIGTYEVQAAEVAATKAESLRSLYHVDSSGTEFWDVHARLEDSHANWTAEAIAQLNPAYEEVSVHAQTSAEAWWAFLDEREATRPN
jgi:pyrroloquinoline-quinone synthase